MWCSQLSQPSTSQAISTLTVHLGLESLKHKCEWASPPPFSFKNFSSTELIYSDGGGDWAPNSRFKGINNQLKPQFLKYDLSSSILTSPKAIKPLTKGRSERSWQEDQVADAVIQSASLSGHLLFEGMTQEWVTQAGTGASLRSGGWR